MKPAPKRSCVYPQRYYGIITWLYSESVMETLKEVVKANNGKPVTPVSFCQFYIKKYNSYWPQSIIAYFMLFDLHREDLIYSDHMMDWIHYERYDARFMTVSEMHSKYHPDLKYKSDCLLWSDTRRTVNFKELRTILLSKDETLL